MSEITETPAPATRARRRRWKLVASVLGVLALVPAYVRAYTIAGASEAPGLLLRDRVLVDLAAYDVKVPYTQVTLVTLAAPRAGDIVLFDVPNRPIIGFKRVVGVPGDSIELPPGSVFVLGDNRDVSNDSRTFGALPTARIRGKLIAVLGSPGSARHREQAAAQAR